MSIYNNLARWTQPTTEAEKTFYAKHAPTISRYGMTLKAIQLIWMCFSVNPATKLLSDNLTRLPMLQPFAPALAIIVLSFMHYILYHEIIETISNWKDKDETTVNGFMNWVIPILLLIGLGILDVKGVTATLRSDGFEGKKAANSTEAKAMLADAYRDYTISMQNVATKRSNDSASIVPSFQKKMDIADKILTYDADDRKKKAAKIAAINADWRVEFGKIRQKAADDIRTAEANYTAEKNRINGKSDSTHTSISQADADDKAKSEANGWWVTAFFMLTFVFMAYKYVILRVTSGIRRNMLFTELDAQGGFFEKFFVVLGNIGQRQGQRFLSWFHEMGSTGAAELRDFDGNVILKAGTYNGGAEVLQTNNVQLPPPTTPPTGGTNTNPPTNGGGGNGGNGGGGSTPTPAPAPPAKALPMPKQQGQMATASIIIEQKDIVETCRFNSLQQDDVLDFLNHYAKDPYHFKHNDMFGVCQNVNPLLRKFENGKWLLIGDIEAVSNALLVLERPTPTPSVVVEKKAITPVAHTQTETTVAQPIFTVPQQKGQIIYTELDDKLNLLKSKLQKEGRSNFTNKEADNSSIRSRICKILDEATGALIVKNAKCNPSVLGEFYRVGKEKLALMKEFGTEPYGGFEDFCTTVENRLGEEVTNG
jgi:hypothetical protein